MSCASASTTQPSARRNTLRSELYEKDNTEMVPAHPGLAGGGAGPSGGGRLLPCSGRPPPHTGAGQSAGTERQLDAGNRPASRVWHSGKHGGKPDAEHPQHEAEVQPRAADGQETAFYTYDPGSGPAEMRLFAALPEGAAGKTLVLRCAEPSALSAMLSSEPVLAPRRN